MPRKSQECQAVRGVRERNALILEWRWLPLRVYTDLCRRHPAVRALPKDDACQAGLLGLVRAAELYDEGRGTRFVTYAYHAVLRRILGEAHAAGLVRLPQGQALGGHARQPVLLSACRLAELPGRADEPGRLARAEDEAVCARLLSGLSPCHREVVRRVVMGGERLRDLAAERGVQADSVRQLLARALRQLRKRSIKMGVTPW